LGRATFILLSEIEHLGKNFEGKEFKAPENVPRLFDLIKVRDEKFRTAFYFALRDTVVAQDIDQATRIAYTPPRYRVVTLQGQVIELAGAMSGGGNQVARGGMSSTLSSEPISKEELNNLEVSLIFFYSFY
jgi:structural maintenance of chromosome 4